MLGGGQTPTPRGSALAPHTAGHHQVPDVTEEPGPAHKAKPSRPMTLQARTCPAAVLRSQLRHGSEAQRVATLSLLGELARSDAPVARKKLPQVVAAVQLVCNDPSAQVRRAVLEFIWELLSSGSQSCWPRDVVGHIFSEYSRSSGRLAAGGLFAWEPQEDRALQSLCVDILGSLDVTRRGMSQLLWPRLLQYVVPAQYSGVLIPLSRGLRALLERRERAGCEEEEEPDAVDSQEQGRSPRECCWVWKGLRPVCVSLCPMNPEQEPRKSKGQSQALAPGEPGAPSWPCWICLHPMRGSLGSPRASTVAVQLLSALCGPQEVRGSGHGGASSSHQPFPLPAARLPAPQALLARTLVLAAAPHTSSGRAVAALQLLQALQGWICGALGTAWATEIPLLLQHLAGRAESSLDSAEWEQHVLKFLRASLKLIEDETWSVGLSQQLSRQLGSSAPGSWQKVCLLPHTGTLPTQAVFTASPPNCASPRAAPAWHCGQSRLLLGESGQSGASPLLTGRAVTASRAQPLLVQLFLYKALGTALAGCRDLSHVQGQVLRFLQDTDSAELSETQGMISVVSHAAETHFNLVLDTVTAFTRDRFYETSTGWKAQLPQGTERPQATRAALMCVYSGIALRAPREQLLARVDREIMGTILQLSRVTQREMQLKLALVQSVTEVSSAIQTVGDAGSFELSSKQEVTQTLLDWIKEEPADSLVYGVFQALEELSKLRPALSREENRSLLAVCCQAVLSSPSFLLNGENICEAPARTAAEW
ncbi:maestro heat-like repeat-containing protein family member 2B isoform X1 [Columba livia]|uniref:maestro heat-like repeat-containing protein family member 2B isoform X1 n=2 Tax=Columba livia TaxID=8932 RepID=UPI0031BA9A5B